MYNLVVAAVFKNEAPILKEWILHYLKWGVEHFYLVNDGSTDNYLEIIKDYPVTLFQNDFKEFIEILNKCIGILIWVCRSIVLLIVATIFNLTRWAIELLRNYDIYKVVLAQ